MTEFLGIEPTREDYWRSVILFGKNVASYKFALANALLEITPSGKTTITLEELAIPYARHITEHLKNVDKQTTSSSSRFLDACRQFNAGQTTQDKLINATVRLGFENVLDAFHNLPAGEIPKLFFDKEQWKTRKAITLTDELLALIEGEQFHHLGQETEARWRAVETSWELGLSRNLIAVDYDARQEILFIEDRNRRTNVTSCRDIINGYQKSKCFYCFRPISIESGSENLTDVDHFFPHLLGKFNIAQPIDGLWNLVLCCQQCNRGTNGKFDRLAHPRYLARLHKRNEFFISSYHLLKIALSSQTGTTEKARREFLQNTYNLAQRRLGTHENMTWETIEYDTAF